MCMGVCACVGREGGPSHLNGRMLRQLLLAARLRTPDLMNFRLGSTMADPSVVAKGREWLGVSSSAPYMHACELDTLCVCVRISVSVHISGN